MTDIRMPRVSGLDLVKYIDEKNYPTKTIILSGYSEFEYAQQALRYGAEISFLSHFNIVIMSRNC